MTDQLASAAARLSRLARRITGRSGNVRRWRKTNLRSIAPDDGSYLGVAVPLLVLIVLCLGAAFAAVAFGHEADAPHGSWYGALKQNGSGVSCCNMTDCQETEYLIKGDHYEALAPNGEWVVVPNEKVLIRHDNPTGRGVLCWTPYLGVICFVAASEG